jgi:hypothetical protein
MNIEFSCFLALTAIDCDSPVSEIQVGGKEINEHAVLASSTQSTVKGGVATPAYFQQLTTDFSAKAHTPPSQD